MDFCSVATMINKKHANEHLDITLIKKISRGINNKRNNVDISTIPVTTITVFWLIGFIEGEGTFKFKNLTPYFQIGQNIKNEHVLKDITYYLESLTSLYFYSNKTPSLKISKTLNKRTNVLVISNSNIDSLFDIIAHHFISCTFQTRKAIDFYYWCIALYMRKYGYYYISQGRDLTVSIASYVNKSRYSTATKNKIMAPVIDIRFLTSILPVKLTPSISHLQLSQQFAKVRKGRLIWIYDNDVVFQGSPFTTVADASVSIGLSRKSLIVRRYLDTGKLYKNRFNFKTNSPFNLTSFN